MADFCNKCAGELFGEDAQPEIDVQQIADSLEPGYFTNVLCEGCGLNAIIKEEDGSIKVGLLPKDENKEELDIFTYDEFLRTRPGL